ncbi:MAG: putative Ig domain-containing protein, partial [Oleiphilaceae bacterium]|nr:putative Ig domain-containing protein [Oleiphilaceae bacterium]
MHDPSHSATALRYALLEGVPFVVVPDDAYNQGIFSSSQQNAQYGLDVYSEQFWIDRVAFYERLMERNKEDKQDGDGGSVVGGGDMHFYDFSQVGEVDANGQQRTEPVHIRGSEAHNTSTPMLYPNIVFGRPDNDTGNDALVGGLASRGDHLYGMAGNDTLLGYGGNDLLDGGLGSDHLQGGTGHDRLLGGEGADQLEGEAGNDMLLGGAGNDILHNGDGNDVILGGTGDDRYEVSSSNGNVWLYDDGGDIYVDGQQITQLQQVAEGAEVYRDNLGHLWASADDRWVVKLGDDSFLTVLHSPSPGTNPLSTSAGFSLPDASPQLPNLANFGFTITPAVAPSVPGGLNTIHADASNPNGSLEYGTANADMMIGYANQNRLIGEGGDDVLLGAGNMDILEGNEGGDQLYAGSPGDVIDGNQPISGPRDVLLGGSGDDYIVGSAGQNFMTGGADQDTILAGAGDDYIWSDSDGTALDGWQVISTIDVSRYLTSQSYPGSTHVRYVSGGGGDVIVAGSGDDFASADDGEDIVDGGAGFDVLVGGHDHDVISGGADIDWIYGDYRDYESGATPRGDLHGNDVLLGGAGDDYIEGNGGHDYILGGDDDDRLRGDYGAGMQTFAGNDVLDGGSGHDTLEGGAGDDLLIGGTGNDYLYGEEGSDTLEGGAGDDLLEGGAGEDFLDGGGGDDILRGGTGLDIYYFDKTATPQSVTIDDPDTMRLVFGTGVHSSMISLGVGSLLIDLGDNNEIHIEGFDINNATADIGLSEVVFASGEVWSYQDLLAVGFDFSGTEEGEALSGSAVTDRLYGLGGNDTLQGFAGDDVLDGGEGADVLQGGSGNDRYYVDHVGDQIIEQANEGQDQVFSRLDHTLDAHIEDLSLLAEQDISGTGNTLDNTLVGNAGNNQLTGLAGNDVLDGQAGSNLLLGGSGDDTYHVRSDGDTVVEHNGQGRDTVIAHVDTVLAEQVEQLVLAPTASHGTGNALANTLIGNARANQLDGGLGADILQGGLGNDVYIVDDDGDQIIEAEQAGKDTVQSSVSHVLAEHVEDLQLTGSDAIDGTGNMADNLLTGNASDNTLTGGAGNDTLEGGLGNDVLDGGSGDDTYVITAGDGHDTIHDSGGDDQLVLSAHYRAGNTLVAQEGNDLVIQHLESGDEIRVVDHFANTATRIETLTLSSLDGAVLGDTGNDTLSGTAADDVLAGFAGDDTLSGGGGDDVLRGGAGNDTYVYALGDGNDLIVDEAGQSTLRLGAGIAAADLSLHDAPSGLVLTIAPEGLPASTITLAQPNLGAAISLLERIELNNGDILSGEELSNLYTGPRAPYAPNQETLSETLRVDHPFSFTVPLESFVVEPGDTVTYSATLASGDASPDWLSFDASTGTFSTHAAYAEMSNVDVRVTATTQAGLTGARLLQLTLPEYQSDNSTGGYWGSEVYTGSSARDVIDTYVGDDQVMAGAGNDTVRTHEDHDLVLAGDGNDQVYGGSGHDTLYGEGGEDRLYGDAGDDLLVGGADEDVLEGGDGDDILIGGAGPDYLYGEGGNDVFVIDDGFEYDEIYAYRSAENEINAVYIRANVDADAAVFTRADQSLVIDFPSTGGQIFLWEYFDSDTADGRFVGEFLPIIFAGGTTPQTLDFTAVNQRTTVATQAADVITGYNTADVLSGLGGDDQIDGRDGDDVLHGDAGMDRLWGNNGDDQLFGGADNDTLYGQNGTDHLEGGDGDDTLHGGAHDDDLYGQAGIDTLNGDNGDDTLDGGSGDDTLNGGFGADTLYGGADHDTLDGGSGNDQLFGGTGNDHLHSHYSQDDVLQGDAGNDTYYVSLGIGSQLVIDEQGLASDQDSLQITLPNNASYRWYRDGNDLMLRVIYADADGVSTLHLRNAFGHTASQVETITINGFAQSLSTLLADSSFQSGTSHTDTLTGLAGMDALQGGDGNDTLDSAGGNDLIAGGDGDDTLRGGQGSDVLDGGAGNDVFEVANAQDGSDDVFIGGEGVDTILATGGNNDLYLGQVDTSIEVIDGGSGTTRLRGKDLDLSQTTLVNIDHILVGSNQKLIATANSDTIRINASSGATVDAGSGDDHIYVQAGSGSGASEMRGGEGHDTLQLDNALTQLNVDILNGIETLDTGDGIQ